MINIQDIIPFMKKGWVAMDKNGTWYWYPEKPELIMNQTQVDFAYIQHCWYCLGHQQIPDTFGIAPADDWTKSLIKVGGK